MFPACLPLLVLATTPASSFAPPYAVLNFSDFEALVRDTAARPDIKSYSAWAENNVPLLDFPDVDVLTTYYYRWRLFREHVESVHDGLTLIDEFLPGSGGHPISCAAGHHFADGMWLRDASVLDDVLEYWFEQAGDVLYQYTHWIGSSAVRRQTLRGNMDSGTQLLQRLLLAWRGGSSTAKGVSYSGYAQKYLDNASSCWWQVDDRDGMEFGISGNGCRPTINAVLYGEAQAIVELAAWLGNASIVAEFEQHREFARRSTLSLWNPKIESFATVPQDVPPQLRKRAAGPKLWPDINFVQNAAACNLTAVRALNATVNVRELFGFMPWYYSAAASPLIPAADVSTYLPMFSQLLDRDGFAGTFGLTTAERRHACYNYTWDKECGKSADMLTCGNSSKKHGSNRNTWNANSWPYESSRVIAGLARLLHNDAYKVAAAAAPAVTVDNYYSLLLQFARQHTRTFAIDENPGQDARIGENMHPDLGYWNTRNWRAQGGEAIGPSYRGNDYFHSSFIDLVINGLVGLDVTKRSGTTVTLSVAPLLPAGSNVSHFCLDGVRTAAHDIAVVPPRSLSVS